MYALNPFFTYVVWNVCILVLYFLELTSLYEADVLFAFVFFLPVIFLSAINYNSFGKINFASICRIIEDRAHVNIFFVCLYVMFWIGVLASIYQIVNYGTPLELEDKINRPIGDHYVQYLVNFLTISSMMSYVAVRFKFGNRIKSISICIVSIALLAIWLNRGAYAPFLVTVIFIEYILAKINNKINKFYLLMVVISISFVILFGYVGSLRMEYVMEYVYHCTINQWYGMPEYIPTGFVQLYIYLTSSLENARHMLFEQSVWEYQYGVKMVYPFVAPFVKDLFSESTNIFPYLDKTLPVGLNVSTYFQSALIDFGYIGPYIYMIYISFYFRICKFFCVKNIFGLLADISLIHMSFWMVFVHAFAIGPFMINMLFFIIIAWAIETNKKGKAL